MTNTTQDLQRIRSVLRLEWDPIGVRDEPRAQDEYDMYAPKIAALLDGGARASDVAGHLLAIERDRMGLPGDPQVAARVAALLIAMRRGQPR